MLPTSRADHTGSGPQPQMTRLVRDGARAPPSWTACVRAEPPSCRAATEPRPRSASVTFIFGEVLTQGWVELTGRPTRLTDFHFVLDQRAAPRAPSVKGM